MTTTPVATTGENRVIDGCDVEADRCTVCLLEEAVRQAFRCEPEVRHGPKGTNPAHITELLPDGSYFYPVLIGIRRFESISDRFDDSMFLLFQRPPEDVWRARFRHLFEPEVETLEWLVERDAIKGRARVVNCTLRPSGDWVVVEFDITTDPGLTRAVPSDETSSDTRAHDGTADERASEASAKARRQLASIPPNQRPERRKLLKRRIARLEREAKYRLVHGRALMRPGWFFNYKVSRHKSSALSFAGKLYPGQNKVGGCHTALTTGANPGWRVVNTRRLALLAIERFLEKPPTDRALAWDRSGKTWLPFEVRPTGKVKNVGVNLIYRVGGDHGLESLDDPPSLRATFEQERDFDPPVAFRTLVVEDGRPVRRTLSVGWTDRIERTSRRRWLVRAGGQKISIPKDALLVFEDGDAPLVHPELSFLSTTGVQPAPSDGFLIEDATVLGTNLHRAHGSKETEGRIVGPASGEHARVGTWSEGCQTFRDVDAFTLFIRLSSLGKAANCPDRAKRRGDCEVLATGRRPEQAVDQLVRCLGKGYVLAAARQRARQLREAELARAAKAAGASKPRRWAKAYRAGKKGAPAERAAAVEEERRYREGLRSLFDAAELDLMSQQARDGRAAVLKTLRKRFPRSVPPSDIAGWLDEWLDDVEGSARDGPGPSGTGRDALHQLAEERTARLAADGHRRCDGHGPGAQLGGGVLDKIPFPPVDPDADRRYEDIWATIVGRPPLKPSKNKKAKQARRRLLTRYPRPMEPCSMRLRYVLIERSQEELASLRDACLHFETCGPDYAIPWRGGLVDEIGRRREEPPSSPSRRLSS